MSIPQYALLQNPTVTPTAMSTTTIPPPATISRLSRLPAFKYLKTSTTPPPSILPAARYVSMRVVY